MIQTDAQLLAIAKLERNRKPPASEAFESILFRYEKLIHYIARRYFRSKEDAMDASQEAALKIYKGIPKVVISEDGNLKAWICTIIARTCLDALRKQKAQTIELTEEIVKGSLPSAEESAEANERVREILAALKKLPDDYRMVLILRDMQGLAYDEIARILEINIGTVKSRISRARANLKKLVDAG